MVLIGSDRRRRGKHTLGYGLCFKGVAVVILAVDVDVQAVVLSRRQGGDRVAALDVLHNNSRFVFGDDIHLGLRRTGAGAQVCVQPEGQHACVAVVPWLGDKGAVEHGEGIAVKPGVQRSVAVVHLGRHLINALRQLVFCELGAEV